ncbi:MAG: hypothetical protein M3P04_04090, partial [Actinomycetota bacterium]|nr:hypothetical protein [Actinomycetota bacterium]
RLADQLEVPGLQAWTATAQARHDWLAGRFTKAEQENARAMALALAKGGDPDVANLAVGGQLLSMQLLRQDLGQFVPALVAYRVDYPHFAILRCFTAYALSEAGDAEAARQELTELTHPGFMDNCRNAEWPGTLWALSRVATTLGEREIGARVYGELAVCSGRWFADWVSTCLGPVDTCLGMLSALTHDHESADRHFAAAAQQARDASCPPWLADAQVQHAAALLHRGGESEQARAVALLTEALATCERMGIDAMAEKARSLLS